MSVDPSDTGRGDVRYCLMLPRKLYDDMRELARSKRYPMAAIFRDCAQLMIERERRLQEDK